MGDGEHLMDNNIENEVIKSLINADMKEMLTFVVDMLAAYPTEQLKEMRESVLISDDIQSNEEIVMVIDEILRLRGE